MISTSAVGWVLSMISLRDRMRSDPILQDRRDDMIVFALGHEALTLLEPAVKIADEERQFVSESSAYRILKAADVIPAPGYVVIKAANDFKDKF